MIRALGKNAGMTEDNSVDDNSAAELYTGWSVPPDDTDRNQWR